MFQPMNFDGGGSNRLINQTFTHTITSTDSAGTIILGSITLSRGTWLVTGNVEVGFSDKDEMTLCSLTNANGSALVPLSRTTANGGGGCTSAGIRVINGDSYTLQIRSYISSTTITKWSNKNINGTISVYKLSDNT